jgi:hypothetical protein
MDDSREVSDEVMRAMLEPEFQKVLDEDPVLEQLEKSKYDPKITFFELMSALSKTYRIDGVAVSCITPAIWSYLWATGNAFANGKEPSEIDVDIFLYLLHEGIEKADRDLVEQAAGFCRDHNISWESAATDLRTMVYLAFRPLEMLPVCGAGGGEEPRFDLDWLTGLVAAVCPLTGKTSDEVIYDMSLCECMYYRIQKAREGDIKGEIRRRNSSEINGEIYMRTMELGRQYWESKQAPQVAVDDEEKDRETSSDSEGNNHD